MVKPKAEVLSYSFPAPGFVFIKNQVKSQKLKKNKAFGFPLLSLKLFFSFLLSAFYFLNSSAFGFQLLAFSQLSSSATETCSASIELPFLTTLYSIDLGRSESLHAFKWENRNFQFVVISPKICYNTSSTENGWLFNLTVILRTSFCRKFYQSVAQKLRFRVTLYVKSHLS